MVPKRARLTRKQTGATIAKAKQAERLHLTKLRAKLQAEADKTERHLEKVRRALAGIEMAIELEFIPEDYNGTLGATCTWTYLPDTGETATTQARRHVQRSYGRARLLTYANLLAWKHWAQENCLPDEP